MSSEQPPSSSSPSPTTATVATELAERGAEALIAVDGVTAVVLGGSWARGEGRPDSDVDLGLYYRGDAAPSIDALRRVAAALDDRGSGDAVTDYGAWGPWMNGGAWLLVGGVRVDWIYRDLDRVRETLGRVIDGDPGCDFYPGYPHAFHHHSYAAEVASCRPLRDSEGVLAELRQQVGAYPGALRDALLARWDHDAGFMLYNARSSAARGDVFHASGCLYRSAAAQVQMLFAHNECWYLNEKGALASIDAFERAPRDFAARVGALLSAPGRDAAALEQSVARMGALLSEVRDLVR